VGIDDDVAKGENGQTFQGQTLSGRTAEPRFLTSFVPGRAVGRGAVGVVSLVVLV